jgi:hypothetical protein
VKVYWRGYSIIIATLNLLRAAMDWGVDFTRYCLLSGSDFPLKKNSHIEEVFSTSTEFLRVDRKLNYNGTTPFNRGDMTGHLKKSGSFGHPAGRVLPARAKSRSEEASDEPADPILPQPPVSCQRTGGAGEHSCA